MSLTPKNWSNFQHYKDRKPAWIKLHHDLLNDYTYARLPLASKALAPLLWLLASEYEDGRITASLDEIAFRVHFTEQDLLEGLRPLISCGLLCDASNSLATGYQPASLERETERQEKTEKESLSELSSDARKSKRFEYPKDFEEEFWSSYPTDANMSKKEAFDAWKRLAADDRKLAARAVPAFRQYCEKNPDYRPIHANRFLLKRRFDGFAAAPNGRGPPVGLSEEQRAKWVRDQIEAENAKNPRADTEGNPDIGTVLERGDRFRQAQVG